MRPYYIVLGPAWRNMTDMELFDWARRHKELQLPDSLPHPTVVYGNPEGLVHVCDVGGRITINGDTTIDQWMRVIDEQGEKWFCRKADLREGLRR